MKIILWFTAGCLLLFASGLILAANGVHSDKTWIAVFGFVISLAVFIRTYVEYLHEKRDSKHDHLYWPRKDQS
jgi:hypothetical protein